MELVRKHFTRICVAGFIITSGFGVILTLWPDFVASIVGAAVPNTFFARLLGVVLVPMGLCYLFALIYNQSKNPLLSVVTVEKLLAVAYMITALAKSQAGWAVILMIIVDLALLVLGTMALFVPDEQSNEIST
ncbi:MAG: hypothetical protein R6V10_15310 [bacterium]